MPGILVQKILLMRIAYIADGNCVHGYKWINHFSKENEVILICDEQHMDYNLYRDNPRVKVYPILPKAYPLRKIWIRKRVVARLKEIIRLHNIDIVHSMYAVPYAFWAYHLDFKKYIVTTRGSDILVDYNNKFNNPSNLNEAFIYRELKQILEKSLNNASYITSTSIRQQRVIRQFINDRKKLVLTRTGVDAAGFLNTFDRLASSTDEVLILSNRAISPLYNIHIIIKAFCLYVERNPDAKAKLAVINFNSNAEYLEQVLKQIKESGQEHRILVLEKKSGRELLQTYKDAAMVVMIPSSDGTPVSAIETMLAKKPLIIGNLQYDEDIFNDETVWKMNSFSAEELCRKFEEIKQSAPHTREAKVNNAYKAAVAKADLNKEVKKIEEMYNSLVSGAKYIPPPQHDSTCTRCILSSSDDPSLTFDNNGVCSHCHSYDQLAAKHNLDDLPGKARELMTLASKIKEEGKNQDYDCILGISGGVDSTYLAYQAKRLGLRPLVVHYDNGWNSELAVSNIQNIVQKLGFDLYTHVNDWEEFRDLQVSFFKASVLDIELITDQAIVAILFKLARKNNLKYILLGNNITTEAILPENWYHWKIDVLNIRAIHKRFGKVKLKTYPAVGFFERLYIDRYIKIKTVPLLNYLPYNKAQAKAIITRELGWKDYGGKHYESIFTRFYQAYYLPVKFGIDKRKAHLSTLICSGQITREDALEEMKKDAYDPKLLAEDKSYVLKKLGWTEQEFEDIMNLPPKSHKDYPSYFNRHYKYQAMLSKAFKHFKSMWGIQDQK